MRTPIEIIVKGNKDLNNLIKDTMSKVIPIFEKYVDKKVVKADNYLLSKLSDELKDLYPKGIAFFDNSSNSIVLRFRICLSGGTYDVQPNTAYCEYFEQSIYFGTHANQILTHVDTIEQIIDGYNLNEVIDLEEELRKVKEYEALKEKLSDLKGNINHAIRSYYDHIFRR